MKHDNEIKQATLYMENANKKLDDEYSKLFGFDISILDNQPIERSDVDDSDSDSDSDDSDEDDMDIEYLFDKNSVLNSKQLGRKLELIHRRNDEFMETNNKK